MAGRTAGTWRFRPVEPNDFDDVTVPSGFRADVLISWGDRVEAGAPAFDVHAQTPEAAQRQFGYNNDYVGVLPHPDGDRFGVLVTNHEYTDENLMFPTGRYSAEDVKRIAMASHGMSVVELRRGPTRARGSSARVARSTLNRRLHVESDFKLVGPAAGDDRLRTTADDTGRLVKGTLNNCAGGLTPWGTVLSGEENFNQYFYAAAPTDRDPRYVASYDRYGVTGVSERRWDEVDPRFDLAAGAARAVPLRLGRRGRPVRPGVDAAQAHDARPLQARGRQRHDRRERPGRRLHGRRRAVRLHLQVRLRGHLRPGHRPAGPATQHAAADHRHPLRRPVPR